MTWVAALLMALMVGAGPVVARTPATALSNEARTAAYLDRIVHSSPRLRIFLQAMPKGGDLHNHAGGANFAEDYLRWAAADGLCISTVTYHIVEPPCTPPEHIPAAGLERTYPHYSRAIDAFSTRGFEAGVGDPEVSGYDRFFATFDAFGPAYSRHVGEAMALTRRQAAADHVSYVELGSGARAGWLLGMKMADADASDLAALYARIAPLLPDAVASARADYDGYDAQGAKFNGCGTADRELPATWRCAISTRRSAPIHRRKCSRNSPSALPWPMPIRVLSASISPRRSMIRWRCATMRCICR